MNKILIICKIQPTFHSTSTLMDELHSIDALVETKVKLSLGWWAPESAFLVSS